MDNKRGSKKRTNTPEVGTDISKGRNVATYLSSDGDVKDRFEFVRVSNGYENFHHAIHQGLIGNKRITLSHLDQFTWWSTTFSRILKAMI
ncbi:MAG: hypothetical protein M1556_00745 [Candidatus Thermoplasmatota archaeon]|jgi:hypothetical protein|nr:hypothetical protein [Candidatus Thermoplasmatota archaeon]MCL6002165.1 hypothetical protein [Candidatus Thermoplasmatota archaeon]